MTLRPLNAALRRQLRVPQWVEGGVVVTDIAPDSAAGIAGVRPGDVILEVAGRAALSPESYRRAVRTQKGPIALLILRQGRPLYLALDAGK